VKERELPLIALRAFAVAARTSNLTSAAKELGVTHGAISKQVNALERWLGQRLFTREGRGLALTPYGQVLAAKLGQALNAQPNPASTLLGCARGLLKAQAQRDLLCDHLLRRSARERCR
jgi:DNA-binding transcriptional LysR family regulator